MLESLTMFVTLNQFLLLSKLKMILHKSINNKGEKIKFHLISCYLNSKGQKFVKSSHLNKSIDKPLFLRIFFYVVFVVFVVTCVSLLFHEFFYWSDLLKYLNCWSQHATPFFSKKRYFYLISSLGHLYIDNDENITKHCFFRDYQSQRLNTTKICEQSV